MHKVAGAVNGVHNPGGAGCEHALGPGGRSLLGNEPAVDRAQSGNAPGTQDTAFQSPAVRPAGFSGSNRGRI